MYSLVALGLLEWLEERTLADDFACETIDPNNPTGAKVEAIFPGAYTTRLFKYSPEG